ncbi:MAG: hypothetical protein H7233_08460 [Pseudorhodobacter sp.]|nr:hypothetical protein [Frankiaceae bacterium]
MTAVGLADGTMAATWASLGRVTGSVAAGRAGARKELDAAAPGAARGGELEAQAETETVHAMASTPVAVQERQRDTAGS